MTRDASTLIIRTVRRRWLWSGIVGVIVVFAIGTAWIESEQSGPRWVSTTIKVSDPCANPDSILVEDYMWDSRDPAPESWHGDVHGVLVIETADTATFIADDGRSVHYNRVGKFSNMPCSIN